VLAGSDRPTDVCFLPREGLLATETLNLPGAVKELTVFVAGATACVDALAFREELQLPLVGLAGHETRHVTAGMLLEVTPPLANQVQGAQVTRIAGVRNTACQRKSSTDLDLVPCS